VRDADCLPGAGEQRGAGHDLAAVLGQAPADHDMRLAGRDRCELTGGHPAQQVRRADGDILQRANAAGAVERGPDELGPDLPVWPRERLVGTPDVGRQLPAGDRSHQDVQSVRRRAFRAAHEATRKGVLVGVDPQPAPGASRARLGDRDRGGKPQRQVTGQPGALGDQGAAVQDTDGALAVAFDAQGSSQRGRSAQRDLRWSAEVSGDPSAYVAAVAAARRAAEAGCDEEGLRHAGGQES
jgi:hypothetical protein